MVSFTVTQLKIRGINMSEEFINLIKEESIEKYHIGVLKMTNEKMLKTNIKNKMLEKGIKTSDLSKKSNLNIVVLIRLLYFPFHKVKLSQSIRICKVLNLNLSDII